MRRSPWDSESGILSALADGEPRSNALVVLVLVSLSSAPTGQGGWSLRRVQAVWSTSLEAIPFARYAQTVMENRWAVVLIGLLVVAVVGAIVGASRLSEL